MPVRANRQWMIALLCGCMLAGCTADVPAISEDTLSTTVQATMEIPIAAESAETTEPSSPREEMPFFTVLENPGNLRFELYSMTTRNMRWYPYNDRLSFCLLYEQDEKGYYFIRLEKHAAEEDGMQISMMELMDRCDGFQLPDHFAWTDTGFVLTGRDTTVNVTVSDSHFGTILTPPEATYTSFARSPAGTYTAYMQRVKTADGYETDAGSIWLRDAAGNAKKIFTNRGVFDENGVYRPELDQIDADVLHAEVVGFMDETHLLCSYTDYGNPCGGAVFDAATGMWTEYRGNWSIRALHDGAAYLIEYDAAQSRTNALWRLDTDGALTCLSAASSPTSPLSDRVGIRFTGGMWILSPIAAENGDLLYFYSADMQTHLATVRFAMLSEKDRMYHFHTETAVGNTVLIGFDGEEVNDDPMPPPSERRTSLDRDG